MSVMAKQINDVKKILLPVGEVAAMLSLSERTIWRMRTDGEMPAPITVGKSIRWRKSDIDRWLRAGCPHRKL